MYQAYGSNVYYYHASGERDLRATCDDNATAKTAAYMLNMAGDLNNKKRQYSAAARMIFAAENLPGFAWRDGV